MTGSDARQVARVAGYACVLLLLGSLVSCGVAAGRDDLGGVMFGFLLIVVALAAMIVWVTARDIAADDPPPEKREARGFDVTMTSEPPPERGPGTPRAP